MATERQRQLILGALVVVLLAVVYRLFTATSPAPVVASNRSAGGAAAGRTQASAKGARGTGTAGAEGTQGVESPDVHLEALDAERVRPKSGERNLFRFKPKPPPPPPEPPRPVQPTMPTMPVNPVPQPPPGPPPVPPITLRFIGVVDSPTRGRKIAALSDGRNTFQGVEGDIIEGRYRILKIGVESIELAYVDGRGRQTIRLTGS
jgi:hypothetical protein